MITSKLIARAASDTINRLGIGYRVSVSFIGYTTGDLSQNNHIDIRLYDSVIKQTGLIQIDNIGSNHPDIDDLPASILEDYPEASIPDSWINKPSSSEDKPDPTISDELNQIMRKDRKDSKVIHDRDLRESYKIYDVNTDNDNDDDFVISDVNQLSYDSLCTIFNDVFKEMMSITMFSVN